MIQEAAYYKAERRELRTGVRAEDWDDAEREIDEKQRLTTRRGATLRAGDDD